MWFCCLHRGGESFLDRADVLFEFILKGMPHACKLCACRCFGILKLEQLNVSFKSLELNLRFDSVETHLIFAAIFLQQIYLLVQLVDEVSLKLSFLFKFHD